MYCPECGQDHHGAERAEREAEQQREAAEVELARINAKRDVEIARITAGAAQQIAADEAVTDTAHAEGVAEGMREVIEAAAPPEAEQLAEAEPLVVTPDELAPEVDAEEIPEADAEGSPVPPPSAPVRRGLGVW